MSDIDFSGLCVNPDQVDLVIFHGNCSDGFGSALAAYTYFKSTDGKNKNGNLVAYFGAQFNQSPPDVTGKNVLICDFSYRAPITKLLLEKAKGLVILDHHKSAEAELKDVPDTNKIFRMDHSGAYITWRYFFGDAEVPKGILYIEDNDIWAKKMPSTREITAFTYSLPFEFAEYEKLLDDKYLTDVVVPIGSGMIRQNDVYIRQAMGSCTVKFAQIGAEYYFIVYNNSSVLKSEIGNALLTRYQNCDFSAVYSVGDAEYYFSLRSSDDRADVSAIASKYKGGGHRNASGMSSKLLFPLGTTLDDYHLYDKLNTIYFGKLSDHNVVYMNYPTKKKHIGSYLIQTRSIDKSGKIIQECYSIIKNIDPDHPHVVCDIAAIWNYDGKHDKTHFALIFKSGAGLEEELTKKYKDCDNFSILGNKITFSVSGPVHIL